MKIPNVSVIIPTYNRANIIGRAIRSVLAQTHQDLELIIVDDASDDDTQAVVESFQDDRIRYIRHEVNRRGAAARNTGIEAATGEYVAFLDSDDEWVENKLEIQLRTIQSASNPRKAVVYSQLFVEKGYTRQVRPRYGKLGEESVVDYLFLRKGLMQTSTLFTSRDVAQAVLFTPHLRRHQDWDWCVKAEEHGVEFLFVEVPLAIWHVAGKDRVSRVMEYQSSLDWLEENSLKFSQKARSAFLAQTVAPMVGQSGKRHLALKYILQAFFLRAVSPTDSLRLVIRSCFDIGLVEEWVSRRRLQ